MRKLGKSPRECNESGADMPCCFLLAAKIGQSNQWKDRRMRKLCENHT